MEKLTTEQKQFINDNFYEGLHENELDRKKFDALSTPYELHYIADNHNWDDGITLLQWIAESNICSEATALQLFWQSNPYDFQQYKLTQQLDGNYQEYENDVFTLLKTIYVKFQENYYTKAAIHFDPKNYMASEPEIPDFMKQAASGEEPYIYYDEKEVNSWFGETLENKISRCDAVIDLYNIASFIKHNRDNRAELILNHPLCDKGIALMIFWRLKTYSGLWCSEYPLLEEIMEKIKNNEYTEIWHYDPKNDTEIKIKKSKAKWEIPHCMQQSI